MKTQILFYLFFILIIFIIFFKKGSSQYLEHYCENGTQTREVHCVDQDGKRVPDKYCKDLKKESLTKSCEKCNLTTPAPITTSTTTPAPTTTSTTTPAPTTTSTTPAPTQCQGEWVLPNCQSPSAYNPDQPSTCNYPSGTVYGKWHTTKSGLDCPQEKLGPTVIEYNRPSKKCPKLKIASTGGLTNTLYNQGGGTMDLKSLIKYWNKAQQEGKQMYLFQGASVQGIVCSFGPAPNGIGPSLGGGGGGGRVGDPVPQAQWTPNSGATVPTSITVLQIGGNFVVGGPIIASWDLANSNGFGTFGSPGQVSAGCAAQNNGNCMSQCAGSCVSMCKGYWNDPPCPTECGNPPKTTQKKWITTGFEDKYCPNKGRTQNGKQCPSTRKTCKNVNSMQIQIQYNDIFPNVKNNIVQNANNYFIKQNKTNATGKVCFAYAPDINFIKIYYLPLTGDFNTRDEVIWADNKNFNNSKKLTNYTHPGRMYSSSFGIQYNGITKNVQCPSSIYCSDCKYPGNYNSLSTPCFKNCCC